MAFGMTNFLRNKLVDYVFRGVTYAPPTDMYVALTTTMPSVSFAGTEVDAASYARVAVACNTDEWAATNGDEYTDDPSTGTTGRTSNNNTINFGNAGEDWGDVVAWEIWDAATGGNRLMFGSIVDGSGYDTTRSISTNDPVAFPVSALAITMV